MINGLSLRWGWWLPHINFGRKSPVVAKMCISLIELYPQWLHTATTSSSLQTQATISWFDSDALASLYSMFEKPQNMFATTCGQLQGWDSARRLQLSLILTAKYRPKPTLSSEFPMVYLLAYISDLYSLHQYLRCLPRTRNGSWMDRIWLVPFRREMRYPLTIPPKPISLGCLAKIIAQSLPALLMS